MNRYLIIALIVLAIIYRKKIAAWLDKQGAPTDDQLPAGLKGLKDKAKSSPVFSELSKMMEAHRAAEQPRNEADLYDVPTAPIDKLVMNQSNYLLLIKPENNKILAQPSLDPESALSSTEYTTKVNRDYLWWPKVLHQEKPNFGY